MKHEKKGRRRPIAAGVACLAAVALPAALLAGSAAPAAAAAAATGTSTIRHVVVIGIDNTHLADIEQMPAVMRFLGGGTLF